MPTNTPHETPGALAQETTFIIHPEIPGQESLERDLDYVIEETQGLARAINLKVLGTHVVKVKRIQAGAFLGKGQRAEIAERIQELKPAVVILNHTLSPVQQRNLEEDWNVKVIDRTGLILEIFGERAQTKEGRLQVELAMLEYQRSRLVRAWTHLERQRGATGFIGGPGETQIEIDRRLIGERISHLKKELETVRRTRDLGRKSRERIPLPVVALVGYTNAGKSTLFNTLTDSNVFAEDLPFATLDPTLRRMALPTGQKVILSDTVGFISDLPTHLIAAFRATLEQTVHADVLVHVIDVSRPDWKAQRADVIDILEELGIEYEREDRIVEVYNKVDMLDDEDYQDFERQVKFGENLVMVSALKRRGLEDLQACISNVFDAKRTQASITLDAADGKALSWVYEHAEILERRDDEMRITLDVMIEPYNLDKFTARFGPSLKDLKTA